MMNILQLTDTHIQSKPDSRLYERSSAETLGNVIEHSLSLGVPFDLVMLTGDLVHDETDEAYALLKQMLSPYQCPLHFIPGNHDHLESMARVLDNIPNEGLHYCELGDWLLVFLDSQIEGEVAGELSNNTLAKLSKLLERNQNKHTLLAMHHPPVKVNSPWMDDIGLRNGQALLDSLTTQPQVKLLVNGHIHQEFQQEIGNITVLGTPATCFQFTPNNSTAEIDSLPPGYRTIALHNNGDFNTKIHFLNAE